MARTAITFNGVSLQDSNVQVRVVSHEDAEHRQVNYQRIGRDGAKLVDEKFDVKVIVMSGIIKDTTAALLEARVDDLKKSLVGTNEKNLDIGYSGGTRRYYCTCTAFKVGREYYNINYVEFSATFVVGLPFGKGLDTTTGEFLACTTAERDSMYFYGSAKPLPKIKLTVNSETNLTAFQFQNTTTGDTVSVTNDLTAGDVVIIDCELLKVTKNGVEIDYSGVFPVFNQGWNDFYCWFTGTAYNVDLKLIYYKLWI